MYSLMICYMYTLCKDSQHFNISLTHPSPHIFNFVCMREHISSTLLANFHFTLQSIVRVSMLILWILRTYSFFFFFFSLCFFIFTMRWFLPYGNANHPQSAIHPCLQGRPPLPPYDLATLLPGMRPEKATTLKDTCTRMFIAALFTMARTWKQSRCPSTDEHSENLLP